MVRSTDYFGEIVVVVRAANERSHNIQTTIGAFVTVSIKTASQGINNYERSFIRTKNVVLVDLTLSSE